MVNHIQDFIATTTRNHVVFSTGGFNDDVHFVDVGLELSSKIEYLLHHRMLSMKAQDILNDIFKSNTFHSNEWGDYLAIKNIGILFEPQLKFDVFSLFNRWSQTQLLIVEQEGSVIENRHFYLTELCIPEYSIDIQEINYITVAK